MTPRTGHLARAADATAKGLRAVIYARVSHDPKKQGKSVADQIKEGRQECAARGWVVAAVFEDNDRSASRHARKERPEHDKLMDYLRAGNADVLITRESSRVQRDLEVYVSLRNLCAEVGLLWCYKGKVHDLTLTDDRFTTGLDALLSEREADEVRDRVMRGQLASANSGRPTAHTPYGYRREYDSRTKALVAQVIEESEAAVIREAAQRYAGGEAITAIMYDFNKRGIHTRRGSLWTATSLGRMIRNPVYLGKRVYQARVHGTGAWDAILAPELFNACARRREETRKHTARDHEPKYLLSRLVLCGVCGSALTGAPSSQWERYNYRCTGTPYAPCSGVAVRVHRLDDYVTELVMERLGRPDAAELFGQDDPDDELLQAMAEADDLRTRHQAFIDEAAAGRLSPKALAGVEEKLLPDIEAAEQQVRNLTLSPVLKDAAREDIREVWPTLALSRRREIVRSLLHLTLNPAGKTGTLPFDSSRVVVVWKHDI